MRYTGQGWEIPIQLSDAQAQAPERSVFEALFEAEYAKLFGRVVAGLDVEITVWSVNATTPPEITAKVAQMQGTTTAEVGISRKLFDPALSEFVQAKVLRRADMEPGAQVQGPAVITEDETTIILPSSRRAICQPDGCIDITV
jgi:N-methylhydantoinase A